MDIDKKNIGWLLEGDPSIRYQTYRDVLDEDKHRVAAERKNIAETGWGKRLLSLQDTDGMWGRGIYSPKWISTTYTTLLLRRLGIEKNPQIEKACALLLNKGFYRDGGINYFASLSYSETCVTGMVLSILAFFKFQDDRVEALVEHLLHQQMSDGGWNCQSYKGATHSSFHTTIIVLEGLREYEKSYTKLRDGVKESQRRGMEFLLQHRLFRSHSTGEIVDQRMLRFSFPPRWHYDIMRTLDYAQECSLARDDRFLEAIQIVRAKRSKGGLWKLQNRYPGKTFFEMEEVGQPSRWNTLRALRILKWWEEKGTEKKEK